MIRKLHTVVVNNINPASIINFLFQEAVIGADDMRSLLKFRDDPQQQCSELLAMLHASENPEAFVQLYAAIEEESHLHWLIDRINNFNRQALIGLLLQRYTIGPSGESPVYIQTQSLALRALRKRKPQETQALASRNKRKRQPIGMLGRSSGNHDWLLANASACVSCGLCLHNARKANGCV